MSFSTISTHISPVLILEPYPKSVVNDFGSVQSGPLKVSGRSISAVLSMPRTEMTDGKLVGIRWLRSSDYDGILPRRFNFCHTARGRGSRCLVPPHRDLDSQRISNVPIHYVLVLKASDRVSGAYEE